MFLAEYPAYKITDLREVTCRQFKVLIAESYARKRIEAGEENVDITETKKRVISATGATACAILDRVIGKGKK